MATILFDKITDDLIEKEQSEPIYFPLSPSDGLTVEEDIINTYKSAFE